MTWVVWRYYRAQVAIALALLAAFAAVELTTGLQMASAWHSLLRTCSATAVNGSGNSCSGGSIIGFLGNDMRVLSVLAPAIIGILWGAPLVAHEMETGTATFAWTQGITRSRWLLAKAGWLLLAAAVWGGAVSALVTFWSGPVNAMRGDQFDGNFFETQGIVPIGYAVFATALGITAGALLRRTLPAIAVTLGGFIGIRILLDGLRPHLMPAVTTITSLTSNWSPPGISWVLGLNVINKAGQIVSYSGFSSTEVDGLPVSALPQACQKLVPAGYASGGNITSAPRGNPLGPVQSCLQSAGFRQAVTYQPGWRYWAFQGIETGIYLLLAAALVAVAWYAVRRRDA